jgi:hypothetical protein
MARRLRTKGRQGERGQVLPLMVGGLVVLLVLVGLVIDTGVAFKERRTAQNISDLAAMAGTRVIADKYLNPSSTVTGANVYAAIDKSITLNGCEEPCTWTGRYVQPDVSLGSFTEMEDVVVEGLIPAGAQGVTVTTARRPGTYFIRVIGQSDWQVAAVGTAMTSRLPDPPAGILLPIGIFDADYKTGQLYTLTEGYEGPGNFGWISWDGSMDANTMADSVCVPDNPEFTLSPSTWFSGATGVMNKSQARDCLDGYIAAQTVVYIPIWKQTNKRPGSNLQYEITGVAAFVLDSYDQQAVEVTGRFVDFYSYPGVPAGFGEPPCSATVDVNCDERFNFFGLVQ